MPVEFRPVDAGQHGLTGDLHPAGNAQAGTVEHHRMKDGARRDIFFFGHRADRFHHVHRSDGVNQIDFFLFQKIA